MLTDTPSLVCLAPCCCNTAYADAFMHCLLMLSSWKGSSVRSLHPLCTHFLYIDWYLVLYRNVQPQTCLPLQSA